MKIFVIFKALIIHHQSSYSGKTRSKEPEYMQQWLTYMTHTEVKTLKAQSTRRWSRSEQVMLRLREPQT